MALRRSRVGRTPLPAGAHATPLAWEVTRMYRDAAQWAKIRHRILVEGVSRRQVVRETGISRKTIRKMLAHPHPPPYGSGSRRYPKLGPHIASIRRMLQENATLP